MTSAWMLWVVLGPGLAAAGTPGTPDVNVEASYEAPRTASGQGAVVVHFGPRTPDIRIDQRPAPRLKLEDSGVLVDRQAPPDRTVQVQVFDPALGSYLDPALPVRFAVSPDPQAPKGPHVVRATVNFAYCSTSQGWCKRGKQPVELSVTIR